MRPPSARLITIILVCLCAATTASAECVGRSARESKKTADFVFEGSATSVNSATSSTQRTAVIDVRQVWKGDVLKSARLYFQPSIDLQISGNVPSGSRSNPSAPAHVVVLQEGRVVDDVIAGGFGLFDTAWLLPGTYQLVMPAVRPQEPAVRRTIEVPQGPGCVWLGGAR